MLKSNFLIYILLYCDIASLLANHDDITYEEAPYNRNNNADIIELK